MFHGFSFSGAIGRRKTNDHRRLFCRKSLEQRTCELDSDKKMGVLSGGERFKYRFLSLLEQKPDLILRYMCLAVNKSSTFHWKYCK